MTRLSLHLWFHCCVYYADRLSQIHQRQYLSLNLCQPYLCIVCHRCTMTSQAQWPATRRWTSTLDTSVFRLQIISTTPCIMHQLPHQWDLTDHHRCRHRHRQWNRSQSRSREILMRMMMMRMAIIFTSRRCCKRSEGDLWDVACPCNCNSWNEGIFTYDKHFCIMNFTFLSERSKM